MTPNELLLWMSARKEGSWVQFRSAVETLDLAASAERGEEDLTLPLHQRIRYNLERLGHIEFDAGECEDGWRVAPPVLALSDHSGMATGVLCGARTPKVVERFERAGGAVQLERTSQAECPRHHPRSRFQRRSVNRVGRTRGGSLPTGRADGFAFTSAARWFAEGIET